MQLWTAYEGTTIDGVFPLTRLLRLEGSSAFFSTSTEDGLQRLLRLVESRPGEDDILSRWRGVAALNHPNILKLEDLGQVVVDDTSLVYAVMEPVEAHLGDVLNEQRLTVPETAQIATSLLSVLGALHSQGFIHGNVHPLHVVGVDEVVKLQCDCIRDAPEGERGQELKKQDVHDLAVLLLQALTRERTLEAATDRPLLPAPFDRIVPKGMSGEWGLAEIAAALETFPAPSGNSQTIVASSTPVALEPAASPSLAESSQPGTREGNAEEGGSLLQEENGLKDLPRKVRLITIALGAAVLLIMAISWQFLPSTPEKSGIAPQPVSATSGNLKGSPSSIVKNSSTPVPPPVQQTQPAGIHGQWRVVAYTYRHEEQAKKKAARITQRHPELQVEVFRPSQASPYLVTVGGTMDRDEALTLAKKVRHEGFPRDTYIQNYVGETRSSASSQ